MKRSIALVGLVISLGLGFWVRSPQPVAARLPIMAEFNGKLRVSNHSEHPIRLALRLKAEKAQGDKYNEKVSQPMGYEAPAHWDFFAGEGKDQGLVVALPNRSVYLKKGDVVVAFAQDGSQRYWGPFIVGETDNPVWNDRTNEWKLILKD